MEIDSRRRLQGIVVSLEETGEARTDAEGTNWQKCVFTLELTGFSSRTPQERMSEQLRRKRVKLARWCSQDWHRKLGVLKTLDPDETEAVLRGEKTDTVSW
ncbi:MAG: hypothetical protein OEW84_00410 [Aigarchaeota archaeon]|nr:hypothetical protein [Aigarchaeota archaeon]